MKNRSIRSRMIVGSLLLAAPVLQALSADTHPCSVVVEDGSRLACYDAAFGAAKPQSTTRAAGVAVPAAAASAGAVAVSAGTGASTGAANAAPLDPVQAFGMDSARPETKKSAEKSEQPEQIESVTSPIRAVSTRMLGELVVELENGQVWTQLETDRRVRLRVGESATISKGALGSYKLVSGSIATKVRRVK